jgi:cytochrome oxidase Cu insertion factor (SCO1/SenC/PrrC family)
MAEDQHEAKVIIIAAGIRLVHLILKRDNGGMIMKQLGVVAFILFIFVLWTTPPATAQFSEAGVEQFRVAVNAPDFTLRELDGKTLSLEEVKGKVVLLNFFASY